MATRERKGNPDDHKFTSLAVPFFSYHKGTAKSKAGVLIKIIFLLSRIQNLHMLLMCHKVISKRKFTSWLTSDKNRGRKPSNTY